MKNIRVFHSVALGDSHKAKNIPCQDAAIVFEDHENGFCLGAVSDGHGSKQYFRSDRGSKLLMEVVKETVSEFVKLQDKNLFDVSFTAVATLSAEAKQKTTRKVRPQDHAFRRLFSAIISKWNDAIREDWSNDKPTPENLKELQVPDSYINLYEEGREIEIAYGCTLIAFVRTNDYWFAFQLGDGKCIAFDEANPGWEPIPWDDQCSGNTTTSICESNALENFRYCYGNDRFPAALFIGSDGLDGAYGDMDEFSIPHLVALYISILRSFVKNGFDKTSEEIEDLLPKLSAQGMARDDMALAGWVDLESVKTVIPVILKKEIDKQENDLSQITDKLKHARAEVQSLENESMMLQEKIDLLQQELNEVFQTEKSVDSPSNTENEVDSSNTSAEEMKNPDSKDLQN